MTQSKIEWSDPLPTREEFEKNSPFGVVPTLESPFGAHARRTDPQTSHDAARSITPDNISELQANIIATLARYGAMTDEQLCLYVRTNGGTQSDQSIRSRRAELVRHGNIQDSGERRQTKRNRKTIVWRLT